GRIPTRSTAAVGRAGLCGCKLRPVVGAPLPDGGVLLGIGFEPCAAAVAAPCGVPRATLTVGIAVGSELATWTELVLTTTIAAGVLVGCGPLPPAELPPLDEPPPLVPRLPPP